MKILVEAIEQAKRLLVEAVSSVVENIEDNGEDVLLNDSFIGNDNSRIRLDSMFMAHEEVIVGFYELIEGKWASGDLRLKEFTLDEIYKIAYILNQKLKETKE